MPLNFLKRYRGVAGIQRKMVENPITAHGDIGLADGKIVNNPHKADLELSQFEQIVCHNS